MAFKRKRLTPQYKKKRTMKKRKLTLRKKIQSVVNRNIETKQSVWSATDGVELLHNYVASIVPGELLYSTQGTGDPMAGDGGNRVGDEVNVKSFTLKGMLELNERYSDVTVLIMIVKAARGDEPTYATLWQGQSNNKLLDSFNTERYTILARKYIKLKAPNGSAYTTNVIPPLAGTGIAFGDSTHFPTLSRSTRMFSITVPGKRFGRNGKIQYVNGTSSPKFFDYRAVCYAYSNYSTDSTAPLVYNVARVNECIRIMKFKDA